MTTETEGLPELAGRVARLEGAYERVDRQLESLDRRYEGLVHSVDQLRSDITGQIEGVNGRIDALRSETNARLDALHKELRMTMIAVITVNLAVISAATAFLAILLR